MLVFKTIPGDFPGGPTVENLPSNAGDTGSIPGWETKIPHATAKTRCSQINKCLKNKTTPPQQTV